MTLGTQLRLAQLQLGGRVLTLTLLKEALQRSDVSQGNLFPGKSSRDVNIGSSPAREGRQSASWVAVTGQ